MAGRVRNSRTPTRRRRTRRAAKTQPETSSEDEDEEDVVQSNGEVGEAEDVSAMEREIRELEDEQVRQTNAYPGASNTIGSVHQRRWYLSLDRPACGFLEKKRNGRSTWELSREGSEDIGASDKAHERTRSGASSQEGSRLAFPFYVRGVDHETSAVTGRRAADILRDEGIQTFNRRKGWMPVLN